MKIIVGIIVLFLVANYVADYFLTNEGISNIKFNAAHKVIDKEFEEVNVKLEDLQEEVGAILQIGKSDSISIDSLKVGQEVIYNHITRKSQKQETKSDSYSNDLKKFFD